MLDLATETSIWVQQRIDDSIAVKQALLEQSALCAEIGDRLVAVYRSGGCSLWFGNGGSAADAQHLAAEFVGKFYLNRAALQAVALSDNTSALTAIGNDFGFECVFARQVEALGRPGDVAIGISTSGNSPNVVAGLQAAKRGGMLAIGLTGQGGGAVREVADYCVSVPSNDTPRIQESHILIGHIWAEMVERAIFTEHGL
jgi:D-sedoheptulose 7-phosphate isomerase